MENQHLFGLIFGLPKVYYLILRGGEDALTWGFLWMRTYRPRRHRVEMLNTIANHILGIRRRWLSDRDDIRLWRRGENKYKATFSSKETWKLTREVQPKINWSPEVWFTFNTPKYSFIVWLAFLDRLATGERIRQWNTQSTSSCILCNDPLETRDHLFFKCQHSETVWKGLTQNMLSTRYTSQWDQILQLLMDKNQDQIDIFLIRYVFQTTLYVIWRERNKRKHGEPPVTPSQLIGVVDKNIRNRLSSICGHHAYQ